MNRTMIIRRVSSVPEEERNHEEQVKGDDVGRELVV